MIGGMKQTIGDDEITPGDGRWHAAYENYEHDPGRPAFVPVAKFERNENGSRTALVLAGAELVPAEWHYEGLGDFLGLVSPANAIVDVQLAHERAAALLKERQDHDELDDVLHVQRVLEGLDIRATKSQARALLHVLGSISDKPEHRGDYIALLGILGRHNRYWT